MTVRDLSLWHSRSAFGHIQDGLQMAQVREGAGPVAVGSHANAPTLGIAPYRRCWRSGAAPGNASETVEFSLTPRHLVDYNFAYSP